jgi:HlyD family secretion protein
MQVTIAVDAYSNRPFEGRVLKIEPQATVTQNVTMFPVLVRISNTNGLLKPGMNAEVEVHVGSRQGVLAVPNAALRTTRDVGSAAQVLGLDAETVADQLAAAQRRDRPDGVPESKMVDAGNDAGGASVTWRGQEITLPEGVNASSKSGYPTGSAACPAYSGIRSPTCFSAKSSAWRSARSGRTSSARS